jgi:hypothetical protein
MSQACSGGSDRLRPGGTSGARWLADGLALAASPSFAIMAILTAVQGGGTGEMLCAAAHLPPFSGMVTMYLLMSTLHAAPWLKLIDASGR